VTQIGPPATPPWQRQSSKTPLKLAQRYRWTIANTIPGTPINLFDRSQFVLVVTSGGNGRRAADLFPTTNEARGPARKIDLSSRDRSPIQEATRIYEG
jgi:hypothetical protein